MSDQAYENTDRELWREGDPDDGMSYYEPSIHVTEQGGIGINVGGTVYVKTLREWHALAGGPQTLLVGRAQEPSSDQLAEKVRDLVTRLGYHARDRSNLYTSLTAEAASMLSELVARLAAAEQPHPSPRRPRTDVTEAELIELAPAGSHWRYAFDDDVYVSLGVYPDWRNPRDWSDGVSPYPVLHFNRVRDGKVVDWFTQDAGHLVGEHSHWQRTDALESVAAEDRAAEVRLRGEQHIQDLEQEANRD